MLALNLKQSVCLSSKLPVKITLSGCFSPEKLQTVLDFPDFLAKHTPA
jgi:hypothetical protein